MAANGASRLEVAGRQVKVSNLDKVLYPEDGTTKHDVLAYVIGVAEPLLAQLASRPLTRKRWPDGVGGSTVFFEKNVPRGAPDWVRTVEIASPGSTRDREVVTYPVLADAAGLVWVSNLAALELHVPQWRVGPRGGIHEPDRLVVDLDPGEPAGLAQCAEVALLVRERLAADGLSCVPVTSGSKGLQLYAPVAGDQAAHLLRGYAHAVARELERTAGSRVVSGMAKAQRGGKVLLDWSQNHHAKTTIAPYSLRGRSWATVACPRTWDEIEAGDLAQVHHREVRDRLADLGDLMAPVAETGARVPVVDEPD